MFALGDTNGDGLPEFLRPADGWWYERLQWRTAAGASGAMSVGTSTHSFQLMDLDGDGINEFIQNQNSGGYAWVNSPTINADLPIATSEAFSPPTRVRWLVDLNGDGLVDTAEVKASDPKRLNVYMNRGDGTFEPYPSPSDLPDTGIIGQAWRDGYETGVRTMDYNLDGRQDLVLVDNGATPDGSALRTHPRALVSSGVGGVSISWRGYPARRPCGWS